MLAGVAPARAAKTFVYMKNNVAGMSVPDGLIARMESAKNPKEKGINICIETIEKVKNIEGVCGIHLMPIGWESTTRDIWARVKLLLRPLV
jgi:methylenetetrahydrofolate reductase (NADPH)